MLHFQIYTRIFKINIFRQFAALEQYCDCRVLAHPPSSGHECGWSRCVLQSCSVIYCAVKRGILHTAGVFILYEKCISPLRYRVLHIAHPYSYLLYLYVIVLYIDILHNIPYYVVGIECMQSTDTNQLQQHIAKYVFIQFAF